MKRPVHLAVIASAVGAASSVANAGVLYEDTFYWVPAGPPGSLAVTVVVNPAVPPTDAWVKIQETVYDDPQGRQVLTNNLGGGLIHGPALPAAPMNLYVYSITNLTYGNGPVMGGGNGVSGFNIVNSFNVPSLGLWGPTGAASWWDSPALNQPFPANFEWDVDANMNGFDGDGNGVLLGNTFNGFMYAVPDGTPHGFLPAWVHTWSGGGLAEQPVSFQIDITNGGFVSGPVPAPGSLVLLASAGLIAIGRRRH